MVSWLAEKDKGQVHPPKTRWALLIFLKMAALSVAVGDSSRDVLGNVKRVAKVLLQAAALDALRVEEEDKARSLDDLIR